MDRLERIALPCAAGAGAAGKAQDVVRDPVCGMTVDPAAGKPSAEHDGHVYHFCCEGCRAKFAADPDAYLTATDPVCGMSGRPRQRAGISPRHDGAGASISARPAARRSSRRDPAELSRRPARRPSRCRRARSTPARCIPRSCATSPATARSAAWRWSRWACRPATKGRTPSSSTSRRRFVGQRGADRSAAGPRHGADARPAGARLARRADRRLAGTRAGDAGGALGRAAVLPSRLASRSVNRSPNMWTLIAHRRRRGLCSSASSRRCSRASSRTSFRDHGGAGAGLLRGGGGDRRAGLRSARSWN